MAGAGNAKGFVLVTTLWALAALALLGAYTNHVVTADVEFAIEDKRVFEAELERRNTEATVTYLLATGRMNHHALILEETQRFSDPRRDRPLSRFGSLGELRVTGAAYAGLGGARFSLQDEGGLIPVNTPKFPPLASFLGRVGIPEGGVAQVIARIEDYIDSDDSLSLNGAERHEYRLRGKEPPLNWLMSSPLELMEVLGIEELVSPALWSRLRPLLTMRPVSSYNFNTMHPEVLAALLDLDTQGLRGVLEERRKGPLSRLTQVAMLSGKHLEIDAMDVAVVPSNFLRLAVWHDILGPRTVVGIELTPLGKSAPWRRDYRYSEPATARNRKDSRPSGDRPLEAATPLLR